MKPPIIANDSGDVLAFRTVELAERALEPVDIEAGTYEIYDAQGQKIEAVVIRPWMRIQLRDAKSQTGQASELASLLRSYLERIGVDPAWIGRASLADLVDKMISDYPAE